MPSWFGCVRRRVGLGALSWCSDARRRLHLPASQPASQPPANCPVVSHRQVLSSTTTGLVGTQGTYQCASGKVPQKSFWAVPQRKKNGRYKLYSGRAARDWLYGKYLSFFFSGALRGIPTPPRLPDECTCLALTGKIGGLRAGCRG